MTRALLGPALAVVWVGVHVREVQEAAFHSRR